VTERLEQIAVEQCTALTVREDEQKPDSLLLNKGARIEAKDKLGNTALILALGQCNTEIVKLLREKGAH
jgi:ankyrin repeat protein